MPGEQGFNPEQRPDKFVIAGIGAAKKEHAHDAALARLNEKPQNEAPRGFWKKAFSGTFWKTVGRQIWKQNLAKDYYELKYQREEERKIEESGSLYVGEKELNPYEKGISEQEQQKRLAKAKKAHEKSMKSLTSRFHDAEGDLAVDLIHQGEKREVLGNSDVERRIKSEMQGLVKAYARGIVDDASLEVHQAEIFARIQGVKPEVLQKGEMYASNILQIARWAKNKVIEETRFQVDQKLAQDIAIQNLDLDFDVVVAKAKTGVQTEAQFNSVERVVESIQKHTFGIFNETTVTAAVAGAYILGKRIIASSVTKAAGLFGVGLAGTGAIAAGREGIRLEKERMQHAREKAQGRDSNKVYADQDRRKKLEESRIQFKSAKDLEDRVQRTLYEKIQGRDVKNLSAEEFQEALWAVAEIDSRKLEGERGIFTRQKKWYQFWRNGKRQRADLIGYSDVTTVTQEQDHLDRVRANAKVKLLEWAVAHGQTKEQFKGQMQAVMDGQIAGFYQGEKGINKQNERFVEFKRKRMWAVAKRAAIIGGSVGLAMQEAMAFHDDSTYGAAEHIKGAIKGQEHFATTGEHNTLLEGAYESGKHHFDQVKDYFYPVPHGSNTTLTEIVNGHHYEFQNGMHFDQPAGDASHYYLTDSAGNHVSPKLEIDSKGNFTQESRQWFSGHGYNLAESGTTHSEGIVGLNQEETHKMFPGLGKHPRVDWHDEPGKFWSEIHHNWLEFEGKQQMGYLVKEGDTVYLDCHAVIANFKQELMERVNSPDFGQVEGNFNEDGTPFVDPGMAHLKQQIIDAVNSGELEKHFSAAVIPTEGANLEGLSDDLPGANPRGLISLKEWSKYFTKPEHLHDGHLPVKHIEMRFDGHVMNTASGAPSVSEIPITHIIPPSGELPPVVVPPIFYAGRRKGLEDTAREGEDIPPIYTSLYYGQISPERMRIYKERMSARLRENPDAELNDYEEIEDYFNRLNPVRLLSTRMLAGQAGEMNRGVVVSVNIPVAGHQEGENIYKTLENYTNQTLDPKKFEIVLFVNHPDVDPAGNIVQPDQTLSEIERFKRDYPNYNVKVMYQVLPRTEAKIGNIRKYLNDAVLWRHHQRGAGLPDLIMVSNDADNKGMAPEYLKNFADKFEQNPKTDAFLGQIDWDPEAYINNPLMHVGTRFFQYVDAQTRRKDLSKVQSSGANFAFKSSIYAAVDGYDDSDVMGEDVVLGAMIKTARHGAKDPERTGIKFAGARVSRLYTNGRRALKALENGLSPIEQWRNGFSAFDDEVRGYKMKEGGVDFDDLAQVNEFLKVLENILNQTLKVVHGKNNIYWQSSPMGNETDKALRLLGIEYKVKGDGNIEIIDASKLLSGLKKYKTEGLELMRKKTAKIADEKLTEVAKDKIKSSIKPQFERNPLSFIYRNAGSIKETGISAKILVPALFEINGFSAQYENAKEQAKFMQGSSLTRRILAQLAKLMAERNPSLLTAWKSADNKTYELWALEINDKFLRDNADRNTLTAVRVNELSSKYKLEPVRFLERIFTLKPSWKNEAEKDFTHAGSPAGRREELLRQTLERLQTSTPTRSPAPVRSLGSPGRPGGEFRPIGRATRGSEASLTRAGVTAPEAPEDVRAVDPKGFLELLRKNRKKIPKKKTASRKK